MTRPHGTRARYVLGPGPGTGPGCRCRPCSAANRDAESKRTRLKTYGQWEPYVDAGPAREHVRALAGCGIGWKRAAELAGVSTGAMSKLLYGGPSDRPPSKRIRPATAARILAVQPSPSSLASRALIPAIGTQRRLQALVAIGWSQARLAARLGMLRPNFGHLMLRPHVAAATARAVLELYRELWNMPPAEDGHRAKISASRARNHARAHGWPPPAAWDDDRIDDPGGQPAEGWERSSRPALGGAELAEEGSELIGQGYTREQAADRLGVRRDTLDQALRRRLGAAA